MTVVVTTTDGMSFRLAERYDVAVAMNGVSVFDTQGWYECPASDGEAVTWIAGREIVRVHVTEIPTVVAA